MDPDAPWWANIIVSVAVAGLAALGAYFASKRGNKALHEDVGEIKTQVKNTHESNLREDIDELRALTRDALSKSEEARSESALAREASHRTSRFVSELHESIRSLEHSVDRKTDLQAHALEEAIQERNRIIKGLTDTIPKVVDRAIRAHESSCPGRSDLK